MGEIISIDVACGTDRSCTECPTNGLKGEQLDKARADIENHLSGVDKTSMIDKRTAESLIRIGMGACEPMSLYESKFTKTEGEE